MDIRYLCWAGYDFLGPGSSPAPSPPSMSAVVGYDEGSGVVNDINSIMAIELIPDMDKRDAIEIQPNISNTIILAPSIKTFPAPRVS